MIGIILIFFIGKQFYKLAEKFNRSKWPYAILGVVSYYAGTFVFAIAYLFMIVDDPEYMDSEEELMASIASVPIGVGFAVSLYFALRNSWRNENANTGSDQEDILDTFVN